MINGDLRTIAMADWLENDLLMEISSCETASSDASFRRYFRVISDKNNYIVMDAPPDKENIEPFIRVAGILAQADVNVPMIYQQNLEDGFLLLEDFGSVCLLDQINIETAGALYQSACDALLNLQTSVLVTECALPHYDEALLQRELSIFEEWFLRELLDMEAPHSLWDRVKDSLISSALEQPTVCVHRDYHSRNLMVLNEDTQGIIDFQDAVVGPITYDLVSLLRDCYVAWPESEVEQWMNDYYDKLLKAALISCSLVQFKRWFDLMGMQRHLKAVGIFARLHLRDGKSNYLQDIPRTLNYIINVCSKYPELAEWGAYLEYQVLPKFEGYLLL